MKKGFTLIEIMVVLVIIGIMASITSNSSSYFKRKNDLKAVSTRALNVIKMARSLAIVARTNVCVKPSGNKFVCCNTGADIDADKCPNVTGDRAKLVKAKLKSFMNEGFKLSNGSVSSDGSKEVEFNSQGIKKIGSATYFRFTATDANSENVAYYVIQVSISGTTRFCSTENSAATKCN